jgi:MerR family redox-sensitive transcriptional activator SoxR
MKIGELARQAGIRASAVRYYEQVGILPPAERVYGQRHYETGAVLRLRFILAAKAAGFTIRDIKRLASVDGNKPLTKSRWRAAANRKLCELESRIEALQQMISVLRNGLACRCGSLADCSFIDEVRPTAPLV